MPYFLSFGARTGPTDADAEWLLSIVQRHPDRNVRITGMFWLVYFFNGGGPKQGPRSEVSRALRDRAAQILLEGMWSKDDIEREHAANAVGSARLWLLYPEFTDAFTHLRYDRVKLTRDYIEEALLNTNLHGYVKLE